MKKMRLESLEHLMNETNENEIVRLGFDLADQSVMDLRLLGIEIDPIETLILCGKEYQREGVVL